MGRLWRPSVRPKPRLLGLSFLLLLAFLGIAEAQDKPPQIAVIPVQGDESLTAQQLSFLTGQLSAELVKAKAFTVLDRGQMEYILKEQGFQQSGACNSSECQVQMGQLLGVEYIVAGALVRFDDLYALRADYIDVASGKVVLSVDQNEEGDLKDVYQALTQGVGQKLAKAVREKKKNTSPVAAPVPSSALPAPAIPEPDPSYNAPPPAKIGVDVADGPRLLPGKTKAAVLLGVAGIVCGVVGVVANSELSSERKTYSQAAFASPEEADSQWKKVTDAESRRNLSYGLALGLLAAGVTVQIAF